MAKRKLTRREFMQLATVTAAGVALPNSIVGATQAPAAPPPTTQSSC